jgi:hypothetical protein
MGVKCPQIYMGQQQSVHPVNFEELSDEQKAELIRHRIAAGELDLEREGVLPELPADTGMPRPVRQPRGSGIVPPESLPGAPVHQHHPVVTRKRSSASVDSVLESRPGRSGSVAKLSGGDAGPEAPPARVAAAPDVHNSNRAQQAAVPVVHAPADVRTEPTVVEAAPEKKPRAPVAFAVNIAAAQEAFDTYCGIPGMYELLKPIGCGAYGAVYLARDPHTGQKVALKHIINAFTSITDARRIFREIKVMKHFVHPNIVKLLHVVRPANTRSFDHIYLVSELMETDLHRVVHSRQDLTSDHISYFLYQVCPVLRLLLLRVWHRPMLCSADVVRAEASAFSKRAAP